MNETLKPIIKELKAANEAFLQKSAKEGLAVVDSTLNGVWLY